MAVHKRNRSPPKCLHKVWPFSIEPVFLLPSDSEKQSLITYLCCSNTMAYWIVVSFSAVLDAESTEPLSGKIYSLWIFVRSNSKLVLAGLHAGQHRSPSPSYSQGGSHRKLCRHLVTADKCYRSDH